MDKDEIVLLLGRMDGKLDSLLDRETKQDARMTKLDDRLHTVEKKVWYASGFAALAAVFASKWLALGLPH